MKKRGHEEGGGDGRGGERERGAQNTPANRLGRALHRWTKGVMVAGPATWCHVQENSLITVWCSQWLASL